MRNILLTGLLAVPSIHCTGQSITTPAPLHESGIFAQTPFEGSDEATMNSIGIQYKRWFSEHFGYRLLVAYGGFRRDEGRFYAGVASDTLIERSTRTRVGLGIIGGGVEAQRRFYKRVHLFAALELSGGYGSGTIDTVTEISPAVTSGNYFRRTETGRGTDARLFYLGLSPAVGAKLCFPNINFGVELLPAVLSFQSASYKANNYTVAEMSLGNTSARLFLNYVFRRG